MKNLEYKFGFGDIHTVSQGAIDFAKTHIKRDGEKIGFFFIFNGLEVCGSSSSDARDLVEKYYLLNQIRRLTLGHKD